MRIPMNRELFAECHLLIRKVTFLPSSLDTSLTEHYAIRDIRITGDTLIFENTLAR
jgi:hypothetical protein